MDQDLEDQLDLLDDEDAEAVLAEREAPADRLARIKSRLGIASPVEPIERGVYIRFAEMHIPGADLVERAGAGMARAFDLVALMHAPSVKAPALGAELYTVLAGRRRILGMIRRGEDGVACNVYSADLTDAQAAAITLVENHARGAAWVRDVQAIAELLHVARLTIDDLAFMFGRARSGAAELARIAKLPDPLLDQIYAGKLSQVEARQLTRLRASEVDRLAAAAAEGETITGDMIRGTLRGQWSEGMSQPLAQVLDLPAPDAEEVDLKARAWDEATAREAQHEWMADHGSEPRAREEDDMPLDWTPSPSFAGDWPKAPVLDMLATLAGDQAKPAKVRALASALRAELERL